MHAREQAQYSGVAWRKKNATVKTQTNIITPNNTHVVIGSHAAGA